MARSTPPDGSLGADLNAIRDANVLQLQKDGCPP